MAACSGGNAGPGFSIDGGAHGDSASGGDGNGILDALRDPVGEAAADPYQSGSRLKAKYYPGADGSKQFIGWHDSMLNIDCSFDTASDGMTRCLPQATGAGAVFADAACTQPLAEVTKGCTAPAYIRSFTPGNGACAAGTDHLFAAGSLFTPGPTIYIGSPMQCTGVPSSNVGEFDLYQEGTEVDVTQYVAASVQTEP
jgi:hypothetical protein